ncbi:LacI family DNA-binding transcriptional regulator [Brooklawnia cerclae]|uniref:LacI family transcriptional regulator n=1 Tax=Brooklawnia cerclae TaxID=349934 RepID=A0ABX0SEB6_9ACTN|nr:LacI family DNA-binding transcriptional regulator [Brooklawnia cerclae]NIH56709.1 LacI family transcriptional regulator [Brooklawnia cerclae]
MNRGTPTRADVARLAGVSVAAVSYAFDERSGKLSDSTRRRILDAAESIGYRPNKLAGGLRRGRTDLVGMMVPDITNPFFAELARSVERHCFERGLMLLLASVDNDPAREEEYIRSLTDLQVTGVIVTSTNFGGISKKAQALIEGSGIPSSRLDRNGDGSVANTIAVDNLLGAKIAVKHLLNHGYRNIFCIGGPKGLSSADLRVEGYREACAGIDGVAGDVVRGTFRFESGYRIAADIVKKAEHLPDAIFASSDVQALGALQAIQEAGFRVPDDIAVIGFDGAREGKYSRPRLTTVAQPIDKLARLAVECVVEQANGKAPSPTPTLLPPQLVRRSSCGCVWDEPVEKGEPQ